jgi:Asp/Glu/hydantoin racemase
MKILYTKKLLIKESIKASKKGCGIIILDCTALKGSTKEIQNNIELPVIDLFSAAILIAESLIKFNLYNSRHERLLISYKINFTHHITNISLYEVSH